MVSATDSNTKQGYSRAASSAVNHRWKAIQKKLLITLFFSSDAPGSNEFVTWSLMFFPVRLIDEVNQVC